MAEKRPLCLYNGSLEELAAADSLPGSAYIPMHVNGGAEWTVDPVTSGVGSIAIGEGSSTDNTIQHAIVIGTTCTASWDGIAIGHTADAASSYAVAIGTDSYASANAIAIGNGATAKTNDCITLGRNLLGSQTTDDIRIGRANVSTFRNQVQIGQGHTSINGGSNEAYSVKIGYGVADVNQNFLDISAKGRVTPFGDEAQYILPSYTTAGLPAVVAGQYGIMYDTTLGEPVWSDGTAWSTFGGGGGGEDYVVINSSGTLPTAAGTDAISIGSEAVATGLNTVSLGHNADASSSTNAVCIGADTTMAGTALSAVCVGRLSNAALTEQVVIGVGIDAADVTTDVAYSLKIGAGNTTNRNLIHLHSKGKLEVVGSDAQFVSPGHTTAEIGTLTGVEGGLIIDSTSKYLNYYDGTDWVPIADTDYVDDTTVSLTGDTMTGNLLITKATPQLVLRETVSNTNNNILVFKDTLNISRAHMYRTNNDQLRLDARTAGGSIGGTVSIKETGGVDFTGGAVTGDTAPTVINHLTRKDYVDTKDETVTYDSATITALTVRTNTTSAWQNVFVHADAKFALVHGEVYGIDSTTSNGERTIYARKDGLTGNPTSSHRMVYGGGGANTTTGEVHRGSGYSIVECSASGYIELYAYSSGGTSPIIRYAIKGYIK